MTMYTEGEEQHSVCNDFWLVLKLRKMVQMQSAVPGSHQLNILSSLDCTGLLPPKIQLLHSVKLHAGKQLDYASGAYCVYIVE